MPSVDRRLRRGYATGATGWRPPRRRQRVLVRAPAGFAPVLKHAACHRSPAFRPSRKPDPISISRRKEGELNRSPELPAGRGIDGRRWLIGRLLRSGRSPSPSQRQPARSHLAVKGIPAVVASVRSIQGTGGSSAWRGYRLPRCPCVTGRKFGSDRLDCGSCLRMVPLGCCRCSLMSRPR
jgi:hypothetical protein